MTQSQQATIAYFTVSENDRTGWTGGLLILDRGGRPLEFQCTLPVRPTRSHEILYGPTLRQHLIGDVIGGLLLKKSKTPIHLLCCDQAEALSLTSIGNCPVVLVAEAAEEDEGPITEEMLAGWSLIEVAGANFCVPLESIDEVRELSKEFIDLPDSVEPFERIREAISEAHSQLARQREAA